MFFTFDRSIIKRNWKNINESPLKRAGLLLRKIERGLIRVDKTKKQTPSRPGRPPKSRAPGHPFRRIYSVPSRFDTNVIVGHVGFGRRQTPMEIHEFGQSVTITRRIPNAPRKRITDPFRRRQVHNLFLQGRIRNRRTKLVKERVKMPERKFAKPTIDRGVKRLPKLWENSVSRATVRA